MLYDLLDDATERLKNSGISSARLDAEMLLADACGVSRSELFLKRDIPFTEENKKYFDRLLTRREQREPLAHIRGQQEFWSLRVNVSSSVMIPRPETEHVVEETLKRIEDRAATLSCLDLCTGSGCIVAALATELPNATFVATDISRDALNVAKENLRFACERVTLVQSNLFSVEGDPLLRMTPNFNIITANPPYIGTKERGLLPPEVERFEPQTALYAGPEGLDVIERILDGAPAFLVPGGWLVMEIGETQAKKICRHACQDDTWWTLDVIRDLAGKERVIALQKNIHG